MDLGVYDFDFDLTFTALLMNPDGTIYHTLGGRTWESATSHLSLSGLARVMRQTLAEHDEYKAKPSPPPVREPLIIEDLAARVPDLKEQECYHCHYVNDFKTRAARAEGTFRRESVWNWPDPIQIGIVLDGEDQALVVDVVDNSPAAGAKISPGDRLLLLGDQRILTMSDVQRVLDGLPGGEAEVGATLLRDGVETTARIALPPGWKVPDPLTFSWRPSKWPLSPKPGFGGPMLRVEEKRDLGLAADAFAFRVKYIVTWGPSAHTGKNAKKAGIRKGDVIVSVAGKDDFESVEHFHSWFRLTRKAGEKVEIVILRDGERKVLRITVVD